MRILRILLFVPALFVLAAVTAALPPASAQVVISATIAPPPLPVYEQPPIPGPGYLWIPGYWAFGPMGYYWVPGTWVLPPAIGLLWTPGWWGWSSGVYVWHAGYWGPHVGYYGGINYGFGYFGSGFEGGYWQGGHFYYNTTYTNVGHTHLQYAYNRNVTYSNTGHVSHQGGPNGIQSQPTTQQQNWAREHHTPPTGPQTRHETAARNYTQFHATVNKGNPPIGATPRPGQFGPKAGAPNTKSGQGGQQKHQ